MIEIRWAAPLCFLLATLPAIAQISSSSESGVSAPAGHAERLTDDREPGAGTFLAGRLAVWQRRLNLEEWNISIVMTRRQELKPGTLGKIRWDKSKKSAVIQVMDPSDYKLPPEEMLRDMEFTLVHELIHLELASLPRNEASRRTEERAVNNIARALLGVHGGGE